MAGRIPTFSARSLSRVVAATLLGTFGCVIAALYLDSFNFQALSPAERNRAIVFDIVVPIIIALPLFYYFLSKLRELAIAHAALTIVASTDSLTAVLNRGAFTSLVDGHLAKFGAPDPDGRGALLILDADNFKVINDTFGHDQGDDALKIIARSIKGAVREVDPVGRIGGEEFGIFLRGSNAMHAEYVAERIRCAVSDAEFTPEGKLFGLSVSIGVAVFADRIAFKELFRVADERLYEAKALGRNRVVVALITTDTQLAA